MTPAENDVRARVEPLRRLLNPDGADLTVLTFDERAGCLRLRLELAGAACGDCVMPKQMLEGVFLDKLRRDGWALAAVDIDDPREP